MTITILAFLVALGVFLVSAAVAGAFRTSNRLDTMVRQYAQPQGLEDLELALPFTTRVVVPLIRGLVRVLARFTPQYFSQATRQRLEIAGNPFNWTVIEFLGLRALSALLGGIVFLIVFGALGANSGVILLLAASGLVLGFYLPMLWLSLKGQSRQREIQKTLPDALDLLTICMEAGLGFDASMAQLVEKWNNEITRLFARVLIEMRLGKARRVALRDMANRTGSGDVATFVAAMIQADQIGVPIAKVLRIHSEQMRVLRRQRAQAKANQTPIKIVFPLAFFIFPSMFIVILGPAMVRIFLNGLF